MDVRLVALAVVLATWWVISACNQFHRGRWTRRVRAHIPLSLIPLWTFFAPNPGRTDSRLVWRTGRDDRWSHWQELYFGFGHHWRRWLIHPELMLNKAVTDTADALIEAARVADGGRSELFGSAYLAVLSTVVSRAESVGASTVQFAVVRSAAGHAGRDLDVIYVSEVHALGGEKRRVRAS